jgi:dUTPase
MTYNITKYELYIYLSKNRDDGEWVSKYKEKVNTHNNNIINGTTTIDSGFDLFMPQNGDEYGYGVDILMPLTTATSVESSMGADGARALNLGVRCCMRENTFTTSSQALLSFQVQAQAQAQAQTPASVMSPDPLIVMHSTISPPCGFYLYPRSSISKTRMRLANSVGIIDSGYRGDIIAAVDSIGVFGSRDIWYIWKDTLFPIKKYDRYFQICSPNLSPFIVHIVETEEELGEQTARGAGGFGSTGL